MRRIVLGILITAYTLFFGSLAIIGCLVIPNGNPLVWLARPWARSILKTCAVRVRVTFRSRPPDRPVIFVTNHQSHFDVLALIHALPGQYRIIAKKELFAIPVFGWALSLARFIKIDRSSPEQARESLRRAGATIRGGTSIVVFAEGTRSRDGSLLPFKKGGFVLAIEGGHAIVPVSISGSRAVMAKDSLDIRRGSIDIVIGEPIETSGYTYEGRNELIAKVRAAVEDGFTDLRRRDFDPRRTVARAGARV